MKAIKTMALLLAISGFGLGAQAQKIKKKSGDISDLKNQSEMNLQFTYDNMAVGKYKEESEYVARKKEEYNKKEAGKGDTWEQAWKDDRENRFEPAFTELFTEHSNMTVSDKAKYTMIVHTTFTEPGFNVGVMRKNAYIDAEITIVETANPEKVVAVLLVDNAPGRDVFGYDFDTGERIKEAYAKMGKSVAKYIK